MKTYEEKFLAKAKEDRYEIRSDPERILSAYEGRKKGASEKAPRKRWVLPLALSSSLLAASIVGLVIGIIHDDTPRGIPWNPDASKTMCEELFSFYSYQGGSDRGPLLKKPLLKEAASEAITPFYETAMAFEDHFSFFLSCHSYSSSLLKAEHVILDKPFVTEKATFEYKAEFTYGDERAFTLYYSDMGAFLSKAEATFRSYYVGGEKEYEVTIRKEEEREEGETEKKIALSFFNVRDESDIFSIERKEELEEDESERSYSLMRFSSLSAYRNEEADLSLSFEIEEDEAKETSFEIEKEEKEFEYESILPTETGFRFDASFEGNEREYSFPDVLLDLEEDGHRYRFGSENRFFPNKSQ